MRKFICFALFVLSLLTNRCLGGEFSPSGLSEGLGYSSEDYGTGAYLGVDISDITRDRVAALKLKDERGVEVTMVDQDAPAGKAGIKEHDVILTMNGATVESGAQLRRMIRETPPGRVVNLGVSRDGQPLTVKVQLADKRKEFAKEHSKDFHIQMPPIPPMPDFPAFVVVHSSARSGLMVENITSQLGDFFGVKNGKGVLVRAVEKGSRAEKAGFRAGDVIVRVNEQTVHDTSDFAHAFRSNSTGAVSVGIVRDKKEQTLTLTLPERKDTGDTFEEESFGFPDIDIEANIDLNKIQTELAGVRPEMERAAHELTMRTAELQGLGLEIESAIEDAMRAVEETGKELCSQAKEIRDSQRQLRQRGHEMRQQVQEQRRELREQQKKLQEQLRHELGGEWVEI
jgi:serine protease Do